MQSHVLSTHSRLEHIQHIPEHILSLKQEESSSEAIVDQAKPQWGEIRTVILKMHIWFKLRHWPDFLLAISPLPFPRLCLFQVYLEMTSMIYISKLLRVYYGKENKNWRMSVIERCLRTAELRGRQKPALHILFRESQLANPYVHTG